MKFVAAAVVGAACFVIPQAYADDAKTHTMVTPDQIEWKDAPGLPPGTKVAVIEGPMNEAVPFTMRIKLPANTKIPPHWHPNVEHVTVLAGTFNIELGDTADGSKTMAVPVGGFTVMQPQTHHFVVQKEEVIVQVHGVGPWQITYINPADDPRT